MLEFYEGHPGMGALGAKLLHEDGSIQHAGMYFEAVETGRWWANVHYFKGLHRTLPEANVERRVPAVTGACLMVGTELFRKVGGCGTRFIQGDYEDSDLCLRLLQAGAGNWYLPSAELYHLEGQSYPISQREATGRYNLYLQTVLWGDYLPAVRARFRNMP